VAPQDAKITFFQMFLGAFHRRGRLRRSGLRAVVLVLFIALFIDFTLMLSTDPPVTRVPPLLATPSDTSMTRKERVFIASMHWNNEPILRSHWNAAVLDLVRHFGAQNVYVSISESGSWDDTKGALRELDIELGKLGVERSIVMDDRTHEDEIKQEPGPLEQGWIWTSRGKKELRRIPYLAAVRNQVMDKLYEIEDESKMQSRPAFDKILWLNDVIFTVDIYNNNILLACTSHC
jgi:hypothetical protein